MHIMEWLHAAKLYIHLAPAPSHGSFVVSTFTPLFAILQYQFSIIKYSHCSYWLQVREHVSSGRMHFDLSFQFQQNIDFFLKVGKIYSIALGLTLLIRMGDYGMVWPVERFYSSNSTFCNPHISMLFHLAATPDLPKGFGYAAWRKESP